MPFPYDRYPWLNFQELNLAYFIEHFREIFQQWDQLLQDQEAWKEATEADLAAWKTETLDALAAWKSQTETAIAGWEADTLAALNAWQTAAETAFEVIRVQAAASATEAGNYATAAQAARTAAETAQAAAEAAAAGISASAAQIAENASDIADIQEELEYEFSNYTDSRYVFQLGVSRTVNDGAIVVSNNSKRASCLPMTAPTRFIKVCPKPNTSIGVGVCIGTVWYVGATYGYPGFTIDTIIDTQLFDNMVLLVVKDSDVTSDDLPEIYTQIGTEIQEQTFNSAVTLSSNDFVNGVWGAGRKITARNTSIATKRMIFAKKGDVVEFYSPSYPVGIVTYNIDGEAYTTAGHVYGYYSPSSETRHVVLDADGLLGVHIKSEDVANPSAEIEPADYDATIKIYNYNSGLIRFLSKKLKPLENYNTSKTIAFLGDSITAGVGTNYLYHMYIHDRFGYTCKNYGYGGSGYARSYPSTGGKMATGQEGMGVTITSSNKIIPNDFLTRIATIPQTIDALIIFGGTNDWSHGDTISFSDFQTAVENVLSYAQTNFGRAPIIVLSPTHRLNDSTPNATTNKTLQDYADELKKICEKYGVYYIDMMGNSGLNPDNANNNTLYYTRDDTSVSDGLHPNHFAHIEIANLIAPVLISKFYAYN